MRTMGTWSKTWMLGDRLPNGAMVLETAGSRDEVFVLAVFREATDSAMYGRCRGEYATWRINPVTGETEHGRYFTEGFLEDAIADLAHRAGLTAR